jgi:hypothetical protein
MAEEIPVAAAPEPVAAPAAAPAAPAPAVLSEAPPAAEPEAPAAPAPEAPAAEAPAAEPAAPAAEAPAPAAPAEGEKPAAEAAPAAEAPAVEAPKYAEVLKVPDGMTIAPDQLTGYSDLLGKHNLSPEVGQELMDFGAGIIKQAEEKMTQRQVDVFTETRRGWVQDAQKQFGNKFDTTVNDAKFAITQLVPDKKARAELWNVLAFTGAGDHPAVIGAMAAAAKILRERGAPGKGLPQNGAKTGSPADRRYAPKS